MVLTQDEQQRLSQRLNAITDFGGLTKVAEKAGVTTRVIQKAESGGNVRVDTMKVVMDSLLAVEAEREKELTRIQKELA